MQGDQLKLIRTTLGLNQQELADAIGMSRKAVGEMERGDAQIEKRTAMAVQHLANATLPFYTRNDPQPQVGDIALAQACVLWGDAGEVEPRVKVVGDPNVYDPEYMSDYGKGHVEWDVLDDAGRLSRLLAHFVVLVLDEGCDPKEVHDAFRVVPEYRQAFHEAFRTRRD